MKKMLFILVFIVGCQQQNLTWTPNPEEWASMTPEQRNAWTANEMRARQARDDSWQRALNNLQQIEVPEREVTIIPNYQPAPSYNPYTEEEIYYRRKNWEETFGRKPDPIPSVSDNLREWNRKMEPFK
jgi:hypothetical protein